MQTSDWTAEVAEERTARDDEHALVEAAKRDPEAFGRLYDVHARAVAHFLYRRTGDHHATEDLLADVFVRALRSLPRYRSRGVPLRHWLLRIADNLASNRATRERGPAADLDGEERAAPEHARDDADLVRAALARVPSRYRTALVLHYVEGLSVAELAALLGCRPGTVQSRLARGRERLRAVLHRMGERHDER